MKKLGLALLSAAVVAMAMTACSGPTPTPAPTETSPVASVTPDPAPTTDPAAEAATVIVSVSSLMILDEQGETLAEFGYFGADAASAVAALTEAFGEAPMQDEAKSWTHPESNAVVSRWPGFELRDLTDQTSYPEALDFWMRVTAAEVNGIEVRSSEGIHVGMAFADVEPYSFWHAVDQGTSRSPATANFRLEQQLVEPARDGEGGPAAFAIGAWGEADRGVIQEILAPAANFGA